MFNSIVLCSPTFPHIAGDMVPRPIAVPYRIGVDICSVRRIRDLIINGPVGRRWQKEGETGIVAGIQRLVDRILTFDEQRAFWKTFVRVKRVPDRGNEGLNVFNPDPTHHLAGR